MTRKITLFIAALFLCGVMQAQNYHWSYNYHDYESNFPLIGEVYINGEVVASSDFEIAAFVGNQVRATEFLFEADPVNFSGHYYAWLGVAYNNAGETVTFKLYDHSTDTEYDNCSTTVLTNANGYGEMWDPVIIEFTVETPISYGPEYPWIPGNYENYMYMETQIQINGVPVTNTNWEVGAFCGDECRGLGDADNWWVSPVDNSDILEMVVGGATGDVINFYLYDVINQEIFHGFCTITLDWMDDDIGDMFEPFVLNFIDDITILDGGYWNVEETWSNGEIPEEFSDVIIAGEVIIPSGYTAYAGEITFTEGGSLTIEPGGELLHSNEIPVIMQMNIDGYLNREDENNSGYRLIASPITPNVTVESTELVTPNNYSFVDLYCFDQSETLEWRNYKQNEFNTLDLKKGYLYASEQNAFATFTGMTLPTNGISVSQDLVYCANAPHGNMCGWNLLGNPFTCKAYIDMPFYVLDPTGSEVVAATEQDTIYPLRGFFVQATEEDQTCTFTTTAPQAKSTLNITLSQNRSIKDNAIIRFDGGRTLGKFQLNQNQAKIYIPQDNKDYAVANANENGEMPINFTTDKNGTYTISINAKEISFCYLHLIDNLTGVDVDLLQTPIYSFDARTSDYASRFKLVFATGVSNDDVFGFYNNGNWIINNDGDATLQVIDVTGRIMSSEEIHGCYSKHIEAVPGVYMLRLINGVDTKVQKIIVK